MSSDSEDDEQLKQFLEATDTALLNNAMFQEKCEAKTSNEGDIDNKTKEILQIKDLPKSQRYIIDDDDTKGTDFNLPETMQKHMAKKLTEILKRTYDFCDISPCDTTTGKKKYKIKSRVKLLKGDETYVNSYEDFEYENKGPEKKPDIKRRCVDYASMENNLNEDERLKSATIEGDFILSQAEVKFWTGKKERKDKMFYYKAGSTGALHAKEESNEFTAARRKNKWNENKIKDFRMK